MNNVARDGLSIPFEVDIPLTQSFCDFLDASLEASKEEALAIGEDGGLCVVYLDRKTIDATVCSIFRIPNVQLSVGINGQVEF